MDAEQAREPEYAGHQSLHGLAVPGVQGFGDLWSDHLGGPLWGVAVRIDKMHDIFALVMAHLECALRIGARITALRPHAAYPSDLRLTCVRDGETVPAAVLVLPLVEVYAGVGEHGSASPLAVKRVSTRDLLSLFRNALRASNERPAKLRSLLTFALYAEEYLPGYERIALRFFYAAQRVPLRLLHSACFTAHCLDSNGNSQSLCAYTAWQAAASLPVSPVPLSVSAAAPMWHSC
jgi:hypothetical protein